VSRRSDDHGVVGAVLGVGAIVGVTFLLTRRASAVESGSPRERAPASPLPLPPPVSHSTREWTPLLQELGTDVPIAAARAWLDQESGGNVCAVGNKPPPGVKYPQEYGLSQLDVNNPANVAILSQADARASCQNAGSLRSDWEVQLRPLSEVERRMHAASAIAHLRSARDHAHTRIASWGWDPDGVDAWKMAKLYHAGPAYVALAPGVEKALGRPPHDFAEFQTSANALGLRAGYRQDSLNRAWTNVANFARRMSAR